MPGRFEKLLLAITAKPRRVEEPPPLLVELFGGRIEGASHSYEMFPFAYQVIRRAGSTLYQAYCTLPEATLVKLREAVTRASQELDPELVEPLTFRRLVETLSQLAARQLASLSITSNVKELAELVAYEAIGLSRVLALVKDVRVTEFFVDSDSSSVYVDHTDAGRCESLILFIERERQALETHTDTFSGYTLDYRTPSLKNDLEVSGARLRISLDLEPLCVNRFSLDVRRLNISTLSARELIDLNVISLEGVALLVGWLESGGNVTIIGETGTGKTTLLNAIDEQVEPRLRRVYIEDAVETRDLLDRGYHQMKLKVDPFERGDAEGRTKESEIVKALHRSPDLVVLSEIQSEEHSRAFFHALSAGAKGLQTFHATTIEQAIRRWVSVHRIPEQSLLDLGLLVQMVRPDKLRPGRYVARICRLAPEDGAMKVSDLFVRDGNFRLAAVAGADWASPPIGVEPGVLLGKVSASMGRLGQIGVKAI